MTQSPEKVKRWKPWQFSLRLLLLMMLVISAFLGGWQANELHRTRKATPAKVATPPPSVTVISLTDGDFQEARLFKQFQMPVTERRRLAAEARQRFLQQQRSASSEAK